MHGFKADISDTASIDTAFQATKIGCGDVDILINNAGIITNNKTFAQQTDADINRTFDINTKGAMFLTLRFLPGMQARECGHICNITSSAGMLALPKMSLYAASKWAAIGWSESLRIELAREKSPVKVTTIAPYFINTGMFDGIESGSGGPQDHLGHPARPGLPRHPLQFTLYPPDAGHLPLPPVQLALRRRVRAVYRNGSFHRQTEIIWH